MNDLDIGIIVVAVLAALGGWRVGFLARVFSWLGLGAGIYVAVRYLAVIVKYFNLSGSVPRIILAIVVLVVAAFVGQALGMMIGSRLHAVLPPGGLRTADRAVGAAMGVLGILAALWLLVPSLAAVPGTISRLTTGSEIARWVSNHMPRPPNTLQALRRLVGEDGFPQVFNIIVPGQAVGSPPRSDPLSQALASAVAASTVKVEGQACGRFQEGSGWTVGRNLVVTNAHVVAGEPAGATEVLLPDGATRRAAVVLYNSDIDLALLRVAGLGEAALPLAKGVVGKMGAVFGHPNGQDQLAVQPATIAEEITAVGYDLYDTHQTQRDVFVLAADLAPGDSGGALVNTAGQVVGIAFAIAPDRASTAYALSVSELRRVLAEPRSGRVSTKACIDG
jgi:S1-C subfamily serine protease